MKTLFFILVFFLSTSLSAGWDNEQKLTASDGDVGDQFGNSVSVDGDYAVIGATGDDDNGDGSGSAYIFNKSGTSWTQQAKIIASYGDVGDHFGHSVSISGDYAVIGAPWDSDNGAGSGSAYIFYRSGTSWTQQAKITASDGEDADWFGHSVSISGDYAVISAYGDNDNGVKSGSAYIFYRSGTGWTQQAKITASDGEAEDWFSYTVSISGDYAVIGSHRDDDNGDDSGSAYIFHRSGTTWTQQAKITASDGTTFDWFGYSVSISGDYAAIGAYGDDDNGEKSGSAYIFHRNGISWTEQAKITASDGEAEDWYGLSIFISGDYAVIGAAYDDDNGSQSGSAYIFQRDGTTWSEQVKITASDGAEGDYFGRSVSLTGDFAVIGAFQDDDNGSQSGSAYIYNNEGVFIEEDQVNMPVNTRLIGNYPNPFNSSTTISFDVAQTTSFVTLDIYNIKGQKVKALINERLVPGRHSVLWNGKNEKNNPVSPGIYFSKMTSDDYLKVKNMILLK